MTIFLLTPKENQFHYAVYYFSLEEALSYYLSSFITFISSRREGLVFGPTIDVCSKCPLFPRNVLSSTILLFVNVMH